jgi:hypothetical protein
MHFPWEEMNKKCVYKYNRVPTIDSSYLFHQSLASHLLDGGGKVFFVPNRGATLITSQTLAGVITATAAPLCAAAFV